MTYNHFNLIMIWGEVGLRWIQIGSGVDFFHQ